MYYIDIIQKSIDYIEEHIKADITVKELASDAGFSLFHYYRIFQGVVGIPVVQYIIKRKLAHAIYEISKGNKIFDVALHFGFNTHSGFFKAFKREYGCPPSEYLKRYKATKPYKINMLKETIMISEKRLKEVLLNWDLIEPIEITNFYFESSGNKAENIWKINDKYKIKVTTNLVQLKNQIAIGNALNKSGLSVPVTISTKDNKEYVQNGDLYFNVSTHIDGDTIKSSEMYGEDSALKSRYLGEIIGQLHLVLNEYAKDFICNEPNLIDTLSNWAIPETKKVVTLPSTFYEDYLNQVKKLYPNLPKQVIHRDPNPSNIIMKDNKLVGFIDFDLTERNIRIFDVCYASTAILSESFVKKDEAKLNSWITIFKNIINGYDSVCYLSDEEHQAIPYVIFAIQFIFVAYLGNKEKYQELAKVNQNMLYWLYENKNLIGMQDFLI